MRIVAAAIIAAWSGIAQAQPAPRVVLDVALPVAEGFTVDPYPSVGRLAIGRDDVQYVLLHTFKPAPDTSRPALEARIDLLALAADGDVTQRRVLPVQPKIGPKGFDLQTLGVVAARSGDLAVLVGGIDPKAAQRRTATTLLRLARDLKLKKTTRIGPPDSVRGRDDREAFYGVEVYLPTTDNAIMLGGGFGPGPQSWWMGKFNLDGKRLWQAGPGRGAPERVPAIAQRRDGTWVSLVVEMRPDKSGTDWFIRRNAAKGKSLARTRLPQPYDSAAAILRDGSVLISDAHPDGTQKAEMAFYDDGGRLQRRAPWPYPRTWLLIAHGEGVAAVVSETTAPDAPTWLVRADAQGTILWRQGPIRVDEIVRLSDSRLAALVRPDRAAQSLRLVHYADP
ncbi:hypothetical protein FHP25_00275 [Vineibacter terrae]|uniref:Uncharacterized protein n=1 Tax=Vineibacter terrae TaxID=2586908 RepID=A0A5C8PW30_9HYPH|nr:hypothetical protein [Vineibacter terrae]TXL82173.1 hypothetical protein FHP25_00275 [Vineibacter terrae]